MGDTDHFRTDVKTLTATARRRWGLSTDEAAAVLRDLADDLEDASWTEFVTGVDPAQYHDPDLDDDREDERR